MRHLKIEAPRQRISLIRRPRLLSQMNAAATHRLCLLIAPAGFGKTTILVQWADQLLRTGRRVAWVSLDEGDGDERQLLAFIVFALDRAGVDVGRLMAHAEQGLVEITPDAALMMIVDAIERCAAPVVLVLDDYYRAANAALDALIVRLTQVSPESFTFALSSRVRPNIGAPQLLASGWASEINAEPLRLTTGETRALMGAELGESELESLMDQTEGWPVALQLARLVLSSDPSPARSIARLTARGGHLSTYLADEVMKALSPEAAAFLLETSILERFNVPLADAVRGRSDSWEMMETLEPLQCLLTPLDNENGWFRYHHLFADCLRRQLVQSRPQDIALLHLAASRWFERNGFVTEAVKHARDAGDFRRCAALIEAAGGWQLILYGGINYLRNLLRHMPPAERMGHPRILFAQSYLQMKDGQLRDAKESFALAADALLIARDEHQPLTDLERDWINLSVLLGIYEDNQIDHATLGSFEALRARVAPDDSMSRGILDCAEAATALCVGHLDYAETTARAAMKSMRAANSVLGLNYCYVHAGVATLYRGDLARSAAYLGEARRMAEENFGADSGLKAISDVLYGALSFWRSGAPHASADEYKRSTAHVLGYDGWFEVFAAGLDVRFRMALAAGRADELEEVVAEGQSLVMDRGLQRLSLIVQAQRLSIALHDRTTAAAKMLGVRLRDALPIGCWRREPRLWRPYQDVGLSLSAWQEEADRALALATVTDVLDCAKAMGAWLPAIRALVRRASLQDRLGRRVAAAADMAQAISLAAPQQIAAPFRQNGLSPLLRAASKQLRADAGSPIDIKFVSDLIGDVDGAPSDGPTHELLSAREMDVAQELSQGLTNKEIARALDMTEHTVKFHMHNIFAKLGVERRAHALAVFQATAGRARL